MYYQGDTTQEHVIVSTSSMGELEERGTKTSGRQARREGPNMRTLRVNKWKLKRVLNSVVGSLNAGINLEIQFPTSYSTWNPLHSVTAYKMEFITM
jgi:hypothetical protein